MKPYPSRAGKPLSQVFNNASALKRTYEFLTLPKTSFEKLIQPNHLETAHKISELPIILAVGDTTYLDYKKILAKREEYGPIGNGGNGLILHSTWAVNPENGQPLGLLWEKLWHREHQKKKQKTQKKIRQFSEKESYRWVEAFSEVQKLWDENPVTQETPPKVIHVFDARRRYCGSL